jgi:hypothetical protein
MISAMPPLRTIGFFAAFTVAGWPVARAQDGPALLPCSAETVGIFAPGPAVDGRTFRLRDGRQVRLAGIEVPPGAAAKEALEALLAGRLVVLKRLAPASDRYGHLLAQVFILRDGSEGWLQHEMIAAGLARAGARIGEPVCATALLAAERSARAAQLGLWVDPYYAVKSTADAAALAAEQGRFGLAEGKVLSVRESGGTIYINFGRAWSRNLTVTILKRNERDFAAAGLELRKLEGRRIRVRGWLEERGGPRIEASRPEQIEIVDRD